MHTIANIWDRLPISLLSAALLAHAAGAQREPIAKRAAATPTTSVNRGVRDSSSNRVRARARSGERCVIGSGSGSTVARPPALARADVGTTPQSEPSPDTTIVTELRALGELADIDIAQYRPATNELILLGPVARPGEGLRHDDWLATVHALGNASFPGVSIDPGPDARLMLVTYFGHIESKHLGANLAEADRRLKMFSTGYDNHDCTKWRDKPASVPTELDLVVAEGQGGDRRPPRGWHRFWFEPSDDPVAEDGTTAQFPVRRLVVRDASVPAGHNSPPARAFANALTASFPTIKDSIPSFAELQREAVLVALAKWMIDRHIPVDREWLRGGSAVTTPKTTPAVTVYRASVSDRAYLERGIHGGVSFQRPNVYAPLSVGAAATAAAALAQRPPRATVWTTHHAGRTYRTLALRVRNPRELTPIRLVGDATPTLAALSVVNDDTAPVTIRLTGPAPQRLVIPGKSQRAIGVKPGTYTIAVSLSCGVKTDTMTLKRGTLLEQRYGCGAPR